MMSGAILAVLTLLEQIVPLLGTSAATTTLIDGIINALTQLMPFIVNEIGTVYTSVKNIVSLLQNSGQMTPVQTASLQSLDTQVDTAWHAVLPQIDPDNPANKGTPAGDPGTV
jgi:phage-related protein